MSQFSNIVFKFDNFAMFNFKEISLLLLLFRIFIHFPVKLQHPIFLQCFNLQDTFNILSYDVLKELDCHVPALIYKGKDLYENNQEGSSYEIHESKEQFEALTQEMATFRTNYENTLKRMALASHSVALVYDEAMMKHSDKGKWPAVPFIAKKNFARNFFPRN